MTTTASTDRRGRRLVLLLAAVLAFATTALLGATTGAGVASVATVSSAGSSSASAVPALESRVGVSPSDSILVVGGHETIGAGQRRDNLPSQSYVVSGCCVAAEDGSEVLLDTSAVKAQAAARGLMKPGECAVICSTVQREAAEQGFSTAGLTVIDDGVSATLRSQVAAQLRAFGAAAQGLENDATIGATALERGIPLITGDRALWQSILKLGGDARWFRPGV